jgi:hypothetical protein
MLQIPTFLTFDFPERGQVLANVLRHSLELPKYHTPRLQLWFPTTQRQLFKALSIIIAVLCLRHYLPAHHLMV